MKAGIAALVIALSGCATAAGPGGSAAFGLGQTVHSNGLALRPIAVVEDSRCPIDAICVWAGRLVVRTEVFGRRWRETRDLEMGKGQKVPGGMLVLVAAAPSKRGDGAIEPASYRLTFDFRPRP